MLGRLFDVSNKLVMLLLLAIVLYPLYYMAIVSISAGDAVSRGDVYFIARGINFHAYHLILKDPAIVRSYLNTILYTSAGVTLNLIMTTLCAYPLSRREFYGRSFFSFFVVFTMFFDGGLIPKYIVVHSLGMVNTIWALIVPVAINVFYLILMRTFFQNVPEEIHEAATMDGVGELRKIIQIVLPLSLPVMATMFLFYSVSHWNSFFSALIYLNDNKLYPIQILLRNIVIQGEMAAQMTDAADRDFQLLSLNIKYAVVYVAILPILFVYPFVQKYFVQGSMLGSVKG